MIKDISITVKPDEAGNKSLIKTLINKELKKQHISFNKDEINTVFEKKSIDARHGTVKLHLKYKVYIGEEPEEATGSVPEWKKATGDKQVIIVGSGPAGLFGALQLLEKGIKPIIIDRGGETTQRKKDIAIISTKHQVNENSNYCFGEGGAGTFSDGKLYTRSNKRGNIQKILSIFAHFGADEKILTDAHPHIGTDRLPQVINAMRDKIIELGGEFHFNTLLTDFILEENGNTPTIKGIVCKDTITNEEKEFYGNAVMLATGHSATDVYMLLAKRAPQALEAKTFAIGVRVEHPRALIDAIQYHGQVPKGLGAAEYRVTTQVKDRGVYSFCMCPGGFVVPSSSGDDELVVNGMSASARNSKWSNAAIVVETRPEDIPEKYKRRAKDMGCADIAGLLYRTYLEKLTKENGDEQAAPAQRLKDFLDNKKSTDLPSSSYTPGLVSSNLASWLPLDISSRLAEGFKLINKNMKGFICNDALMIAIESRTSTPVRIKRNKETLECVAVKNLYPSGEGSGYAGGIVSSAMDGENTIKAIIANLRNL